MLRKEADPVTELNNLFDRAVSIFAFMPYAYVVDKFRWDVFSERVKEEELNCHWVKMRLDVQGTYH